MADEQRTPDNGPHEDEQTPHGRGGLGRFTSRFRRDRQASVEESTPAARYYPAPLTGARDDLGTVPQLAPELDLTITPRPAGLAEPPSPEPAQPGDEGTWDVTPPSPTDEDRAAVVENPPVPEAVRADAGLAGEPAKTPDTEQPAEVEKSLPPSPLPLVGVEAAPEPPPVLRLAEDAPEALPPLVPLSGIESPDVPPATRTRPGGISAHLVVVSALATMVMLAFLLIEPSPRWLLLLGAAAVVFGLDGTLRQTWREPFALGQETAPFLFVPALYVMAIPVLIEHNISGELVLLVGLGAGLGFGALAWAEVASVRPMADEYEQARLVVTANTYLTGFAVFSLSYVFDLSLPAAILATAIAASMLAVEVLREGEIDPMETLGLSLVAGVIVGEMRWLLYYVPLDTYLAGLTLLLVFYLATGLLHSHVIRALNRAVAAEYGGIAAAGLALVIVARAAGLA